MTFDKKEVLKYKLTPLSGVEKNAVSGHFCKVCLQSHIHQSVMCMLCRSHKQKIIKSLDHTCQSEIGSQELKHYCNKLGLVQESKKETPSSRKKELRRLCPS